MVLRINWEKEIYLASERMNEEQYFQRFRFPAFQPQSNFHRPNGKDLENPVSKDPF